MCLYPYAKLYFVGVARRRLKEITMAEESTPGVPLAPSPALR